MKNLRFILLAGAILCAACAPVELDIVTVDAPAINCLFDSDCSIVVNDMASELELVGMTGTGFLQSRTAPPGEAGTVAAGLYDYEYRIDLRQMSGILNIACVDTLTVEFGPVSELDYDGSGDADASYVITRGGLGNIAPSVAEQVGNVLKFGFSPGVCPGGAPGNGDSSYFFGLASAHPPHTVDATIRDSEGQEYSLEVQAPDFP